MAFLGLIGLCVAFGGFLVWRLRRDVEHDAPPSEEDVLRDLERAYFDGEMDREEFERVRASIVSKRPGPVPATKPQPLPELPPEPPIPHEEFPSGPA